MTPAEIKAIAIVKHRAEIAVAERYSREQAVAVANILHASRQEIDALNSDNQGDHMRALERRESGRFDYATAVKDLRQSLTRLSAYGDLIRMLDTAPRLIGSLSRLRWGADLARFVPPADIDALESCGLVDRQAKVASVAGAPVSILTATGHAVLAIHREIAAPTEDR